MIVPEPFLKPRGTPISVYGRTRALSKLGYHIDLVTYHIGEKISLPNVSVHRIPEVPFIKEIAVGPSLPKIVLDFFLMVKTVLMLLARDYDIIHSHEEGAFWGAFLAKIFGKKHIYDMHSSLPQQFGNFHYANFSVVRAVFAWFERFVIRNSQGVIYICPDLKTVIDEIDKNKSTVLIENFGAEEGFSNNKTDPVELENCNGKFKLLYAGTLESYQGIDLLVNSMKHIESSDFLLLVVGGEAEQIKKYEKMASEIGVEGRVRFLGKVSPTEVEAYYQVADALISTRVKGTNTPLKIYKYLMSGKPVIATRIWSHTQILNENIAVLVDVDESDVAEKLNRVISDRDALRKIQENAREYVKEKFTYEEYLRLTSSIYESV